MELSTLATDLQSRVPHQTLPKHVGKPQFHQIREIQKLIEENSGTIECSLPGVGDFNHLFLTKSDAEWTALTGLPPVQMPERPERPEINDRATAAQIAQQDRAYNTAKKLYDKTIAMKELLMNQLTTSFEPKWIQPLRHAVTRQLNHRAMHEIFTFLYTRYGKVKSQTVRDKEDELLTAPVDLDLPLIILFDDIEDFRVLAQSARVPKTNAQIMDMTLTILKNCGCFTNALIEWKNRPEAEKTWPNLKTHFDTAHQDLQDASDMPIGGTSFQTNVLATQVAESVSNDIRQELNMLQQNVYQALQLSGDQAQKENEPPIKYHNAGENKSNIGQMEDLKSFFKNQLNNIQEEHKKELDSLKQQVKNVRNNNRRGNRNNNSNSQRDNDSDGDEQEEELFWEGPRCRSDISKYCWTHGACNHSGTGCRRPAPKHKKNATFSNRMGGSTAFCQFVKQK